MFTPIVNTAVLPSLSTLVTTALPNSNALRVPHDNVPPTVSIPEVGNNASGNNSAASKIPSQLQSLPELAGETTERFSFFKNSSRASLTANPQTTFLTQLASGDISPEVKGIFIQYNKLVSYANVKYKPSNAGKPAEPSSAFSVLLQREKPSAVNVDRGSGEKVAPIVFSPSIETSSSDITVFDETGGAEIELTSNAVASEAAIISDNQGTSPENNISLSQRNPYIETIIRNTNVSPNDLEVV